MKRAMTIGVAILVGLAWYVPHAKREAVNACRFEVAKKWNDVLDNVCIQTWSPFYNKNGNNAFPTCDEMGMAKKFMTACMAASGFSTADDCNTDASARFLRNCYRRSMPLQIFDTIAESDLISDSTASPWMGYIWNSADQRYEWLLAGFKNLNECQSALERNVGTFSYTRPVGCTYHGNNLLRVRIMNSLTGRITPVLPSPRKTPPRPRKLACDTAPQSDQCRLIQTHHGTASTLPAIPKRLKVQQTPPLRRIADFFATQLVRLWHEAAVPAAPTHVRSWG